MKRWLWVLILPLFLWGVFEKTETGHYDIYNVERDTLTLGDDASLETRFCCMGHAKDMAEALNEAHKRRVHPEKVPYNYEIFTTSGCPTCVNAKPD